MYNDTERILASNVDAFTLYKELISSFNSKIVYVTKYMMFIGYCTIYNIPCNNYYFYNHSKLYPMFICKKQKLTAKWDTLKSKRTLQSKPSFIDISLPGKQR